MRSSANKRLRPLTRPLPDPRRLWLYAVLIALAGIAARAGWYLYFRDEFALRLGPDGRIYALQAIGYIQDALVDPSAAALANAHREMFAPGYPMFLAGIWDLLPRVDVVLGREYVLLTVRAAQWLLAGATTLMTFALARRVLFGYASLIPPALVTVSIAMVDLPSLLAYETLLAFLLTATILLLVKAGETKASNRRALPAWILIAVGGLALSYAILVQPRVAIVLPFVLVWLVHAVAKRHAILFLLLAIVLPAGWIARDYIHYDQFVPIAINGQAALYTDNVDPIGGSGVVSGPLATPPACPRSMLQPDDMQQHIAWGRCMRDAGLAEITDHPATSLLAFGDRIAALASPWNPEHARGNYDSSPWSYHRLVPSSVRSEQTFQRTDDLLNAVWIALYLALIAVGIANLWAEGAGSSARLIAIPILTLPLVHLLFHAENRFRLPMLPLIAIAMTLGLVSLIELRRSSRSGQRRDSTSRNETS